MGVLNSFIQILASLSEDTYMLAQLSDWMLSSSAAGLFFLSNNLLDRITEKYHLCASKLVGARRKQNTAPL